MKAAGETSLPLKGQGSKLGYEFGSYQVEIIFKVMQLNEIRWGDRSPGPAPSLTPAGGAQKGLPGDRGTPGGQEECFRKQSCPRPAAAGRRGQRTSDKQPAGLATRRPLQRDIGHGDGVTFDSASQEHGKARRVGVSFVLVQPGVGRRSQSPGKAGRERTVSQISVRPSPECLTHLLPPWPTR